MSCTNVCWNTNVDIKFSAHNGFLEYLSLMCSCMKNKKYHTVRTVPNSNRQIVEPGQIPIEKSWIQDRGMEQFQIPMGKSWIQDRSMEQFQIPIEKSYKQNRGKIDTSYKHIHTAITIILINKVYGVSRHFQQHFSYIVGSILLVEETAGVPGENHRPAASH